MATWLNVQCSEIMHAQITKKMCEARLFVEFNDRQYEVSDCVLRTISHLVLAMLESSSQKIVLKCPVVSVDTFESLLPFFNSGLMKKIMHTCESIVEIVIFSDYIQSEILFEYALGIFHRDPLSIAACDKFHRSTLPDNLFLKMLSGLSDSVRFELWIQYTFRSISTENSEIEAPKAWRDSLAEISLQYISRGQISCALQHMPPEILRYLDPRGLMVKIIRNSPENEAILPN